MSTPEEYTQSPADEFHLACALLSPTATVYLTDTLDAVDPNDFYDPTIGRLWAAARVIHASGTRVTKRALLAAADDISGLNVPAVRARLDQIAGEPVYISRLQSSIQAGR